MSDSSRRSSPADTVADATWQRGTAMRRQVLGSGYVERSLASATDFDRDFQDYITRAVWGDIWSRPGLNPQTRQLLTLVMLATLNRQDELAIHLEATQNTGVSVEQVREALMQVAVYAGVPAARAALLTAKRVLFPADGAERQSPLSHAHSSEMRSASR